MLQVKLLLKPRVQMKQECISLLVTLDDEDPKRMLFYTDSTVSKVVQKLHARVDSLVNKSHPHYGLYLYTEKKGIFLDERKTLREYNIKPMVCNST